MNWRDVLVPIRTTLLLVLLTGIGFPALVYGVARVVFPHQANTSLVRNHCGVVVGSALVGQQFTSARWFHGRPSANAYNGVASGGTNLSATSAALAESLTVRAARFRVENGLDASASVPADAITASGSGLDPDISVATALLQVQRVSRARQAEGVQNANTNAVTALVQRHVVGKFPYGDGQVNVLMLNLALDSLSGISPCRTPGA